MNLLNTIDMSRDEIEQLLDSALRFKHGDDHSKPLADKSVALVFFNPSLRTRASLRTSLSVIGFGPERARGSISSIVLTLATLHRAASDALIMCHRCVVLAEQFQVRRKTR